MVEVQLPLTVADDSREFEGSEEGGVEEAWLREVEEVAAQFLRLYLEDQPGAQPLGGGKSPAARLASGLEQSSPSSSNAPEIARKLKGIGDDLDAKVRKEITEATAELLRHQSLFQVGAAQFNDVCSNVLSSCSSVMTTGWQQVGAVYLTLGQLTRQLHTAQPPVQSADVITGRFNRFTGQYMTEVGLDTWIQDHGGLASLVDGMSDYGQDQQEGDMVYIADSGT